ncbi:tRNA(adenine(34)) deaminase, chloroplastic [Auxenochlorella protothecoides]|uniref:tRNA(adenine(34)) deaminase n=1 Tax=Auxenochlorella protothecoides TaxID=3075 RepID=A0A087SKW0_AUXPR|nr:tRNA(adenine(34)) deaminase, chloroplastic [Auxenochlorella protothecoides]KFM26364.1 tRNA(adenine(34)) deaminase, chloroplastic [Auxenochlorella protothecoides]
MAPSRRASPDHRRCTFEAVPPGYDSCPPLEAGLDSHYMRLALDQAHKAASKGEVPIGAVLAAADGSLLASAHNEVEATGDPTAHAEMLCLRRAAGVAPSWRMPAATLYVTVEPCAMCAGGALAARLAAVVYGARSPLMGADGSWVRGGVLADECQRLMVEFFRARRRGEVRGPPGAGSPVQREAS